MNKHISWSTSVLETDIFPFLSIDRHHYYDNSVRKQHSEVAALVFLISNVVVIGILQLMITPQLKILAAHNIISNKNTAT
jgi:hypothetical protein